jgi:hypothetical protein
MATKNKKRTIDGGPNVYDFQAAIFDNTPQHERYVIFMIANAVTLSSGEFLQPQPCVATITGVDIQDSSKGYLAFWGKTVEGGSFKKDSKINGQYSTQTRKGWIEFQPK